MELNLPKNFPQAFSNGLIVLPYDPNEEKTTESGLLIVASTTTTDGQRTMQGHGIVCHVGPEVQKTLIDPETSKIRVVQKGDKVSYPPFYDSGFFLKGIWYLSMSALDIKVFYPDDEAIPVAKERKSRKRSAIEKNDNKYK